MFDGVLPERITDRVHEMPYCGCWVWAGGVNHAGYGAVMYKGRDWSVHRLMWSAKVGPIPPGMCVLHKCDNPPCCNPDHLFLGSKADNARDRDAKRRSASKLTAEQVFEIRRRDASGPVLAREYGVSITNINHIRARKRWLHLPPESDHPRGTDTEDNR